MIPKINHPVHLVLAALLVLGSTAGSVQAQATPAVPGDLAGMIPGGQGLITQVTGLIEGLLGDDQQAAAPAAPADGAAPAARANPAAGAAPLGIPDLGNLTQGLDRVIPGAGTEKA